MKLFSRDVNKYKDKANVKNYKAQLKNIYKILGWYGMGRQ